MGKFKDMQIDLMNAPCGAQVVLQPGEVWVPRERPAGELSFPIFGEIKEDQDDKPECKIHVWKKVTLFRTTVEECVKCGKLRDDS